MLLPRRGPAVWKQMDEVAEVRGGYIPSSSVPSEAKPTVRALLAGDVATNGEIPWSALRSISAPRDLSRYEVRDGDVVFPLRATRLLAAVAREVPASVIAMGNWAVLTPRPGYVTPQFLAWYLNHPATVRRLAQLSQGSKLQFLSIAAIREFNVELPGLKLQALISRAHQLQARATELEQQLGNVRKHLVDALTMQALRVGESPQSESNRLDGGSLNDD